MSYVTVGAATFPAIQTRLIDLGYLSAKDAAGGVGPKTMTAVNRLARDAVTDFAASINASQPSDERTIAVSGLKGVQNKLDAAPAGDFTALQAAQAKLKDVWTRWIKAGGRGTTDRAAAFTSATLVKPGTGRVAKKTTTPGVIDIAPVEPVAPVGFDLRSKLPLIAGGVIGVGALLYVVSRK